MTRPRRDDITSKLPEVYCQGKIWSIHVFPCWFWRYICFLVQSCVEERFLCQENLECSGSTEPSILRVFNSRTSAEILRRDRWFDVVFLFVDVIGGRLDVWTDLLARNLECSGSTEPSIFRVFNSRTSAEVLRRDRLFSVKLPFRRCRRRAS